MWIKDTSALTLEETSISKYFQPSSKSYFSPPPSTLTRLTLIDRGHDTPNCRRPSNFFNVRLEVFVNLEHLTWIEPSRTNAWPTQSFRRCKFALKSFSTTLFMYSPEAVEFLTLQPSIQYMKSSNRSPTPPGFVHSENILPLLQTLHCTESFLHSLTGAGRNIRPLQDLRLELRRSDTSSSPFSTGPERDETLQCLAFFSQTLTRLSLQLSDATQSASGGVFSPRKGKQAVPVNVKRDGHIDLLSILSGILPDGKTFPHVSQLELGGWEVDNGFVPVVARTIVKYFPNIEGFTWMPLGHPLQNPDQGLNPAAIMFSTCHSLMEMTYLDNKVIDKEGHRKAIVVKKDGGDLQKAFGELRIPTLDG
ncbi:hypothetical protein C8Q75DRAFT_208607 [Abortiporus biennis]|nr:hypothetical protein C8Q75DRAFT_208607 [Abortiporus biennis]